jgi:signal transduction histidine kinase/ligand-binding sensor domain-containing protein/DNA-binding response OmpR family regulator
MGADPTLVFERFNTDQGLSQNTARALLQDSRGFIWIGTNDGLNRFDGYEFTTFKSDPQDKNSISSNHIFTLYEDSKGIIWIGTFEGLNRLDHETLRFTRFQHERDNPRSLSNNRVSAITEDARGRLWVGTYGGGLNRLDSSTAQFTRYTIQEENGSNELKNHIWSLTSDNENTLWLSTGNSVRQYDEITDRFIKILPNYTYDAQTIKNIRQLHYNDDNTLWIGTSSLGLFKFNSRKNTLLNYQHAPADPQSISHNNIQSILDDNKGNVWVGTAKSLNRLHINEERFSQYIHDPTDASSINVGFTIQIIQSKDEQLWFGSTQGGISTTNVASEKLGHFNVRQTNIQDKYGEVRAIIEDKDQHVWLGTKRGLLVLDHNMDEIEWFTHNPNDNNSLSSNGIYALHESKQGDIWIGTANGGLNKFNPKNRQFTHFKHDENNNRSISDNKILSIYQDSQGVIWAGTFSGGLNRYNRETNDFTRYLSNPNNPNSLSRDRVSTIIEDNWGNLWIGLHDGGLNKMNVARDQISRFQHDKDNIRSLSNDIVLSLYKDSVGRIWIGTMGGGLNLYNKSSNDFTHFRSPKSLPNDAITGILEDEKGDLWLSSFNGLFKFSPETLTSTVYNQKEGAQRQFSFWASYTKGKSGLLYFGGDNGINRFAPAQIQKNLIKPDIFLTDFLLFNKSVAISPNKQLAHSPAYQINKAIYAQKHIMLTHQQSLFSFEFSALHYADNSRNQYAYQLEGWDKDWIATDHKRRHATYTNIPAGDYTFKVKASNKDGVWNETGSSINIHISPPWYRTYWAFLTYCIAGIVMVWFIVYLRTRQAHLLNQTLSEKVKERTTKIESLLRQKDTLFANISHEFRTPLTLILGPIEALLTDPEDRTVQKQLPMIKRNAVSLLNMVEQLLDIAHHEQLKEQQLTTVLVGTIIDNICADFDTVAQKKNITFTQKIRQGLSIKCSPDEFDKIITNLLSNAFKYTPSGGMVNIELSERQEEVIIAISDSGIGIQSSDQKTIFERFTRADNAVLTGIHGSGIGLALVDQLVEFYGGRIELQSTLGIGSCFSVIFPLCANTQTKHEPYTHNAIRDSALDSIVSSHEAYKDEPQQALNEVVDFDIDTILIIDDNRDMCLYIKACLEPKYQCLIANTPQHGFQIAHQVVPDIIISDVMMPKIDGTQLTQQLKQNRITSHIPVILLTAVANHKDRIKGLRAQADDYMTKPFDIEELQLKVSNLLHLRQVQQEWLQKNLPMEASIQPPLLESKNKLSSREQRFLDRFSEYIAQHYENAELSVVMLADRLGLTSRSLLRKVKALTGLTVNEYIRSYRLEKSKLLLEQGDSVTEASLSVGFLSQHYFSRCFKARYEMTPSEYSLKATTKKA